MRSPLVKVFPLWCPFMRRAFVYISITQPTRSKSEPAPWIAVVPPRWRRRFIRFEHADQFPVDSPHLLGQHVVVTPAVHLGCRHTGMGRYPQQPVRVFGEMLHPPRWFGNDYAAVGARDQRGVNIRCGRLRVHDERCDCGRLSLSQGVNALLSERYTCILPKARPRSRTTVWMN